MNVNKAAPRTPRGNIMALLTAMSLQEANNTLRAASHMARAKSEVKGMRCPSIEDAVERISTLLDQGQDEDAYNHLVKFEMEVRALAGSLRRATTDMKAAIRWTTGLHVRREDTLRTSLG